MDKCHRAHGPFLATTKGKEKEDEGHDPSQPAPRLAIKETGSHQHIPVASDELAPSDGLFSFRDRWDTMAIEDIAHCLITDRIAQMLRGPLHAIIAHQRVIIESCV
jgi:hypothetical protein